MSGAETHYMARDIESRILAGIRADDRALDIGAGLGSALVLGVFVASVSGSVS